MADEQEYDRKEGAQRLRDLASENITPVLRGLEDVMKFYSDKIPKDEADEREYMRGMWRRLEPHRNAINRLMDRL